MSLVGVPYPSKETVVRIQGEPHLARTCPVCKVVVFDKTDDMGETTTTNYGEHCQNEHPES